MGTVIEKGATLFGVPMRKERFPEVMEKLWEGHLWSPSYFAASCGGAPLEVIRQYIEEQRA